MKLVKDKIHNYFGKLIRIDYSLIGYEHRNKESLLYHLEQIYRHTLTQEQRNGMTKGRLSNRNLSHPIATQLLILSRITMKDETNNN